MTFQNVYHATEPPMVVGSLNTWSFFVFYLTVYVSRAEMQKMMTPLFSLNRMHDYMDVNHDLYVREV